MSIQEKCITCDATLNESRIKKKICHRKKHMARFDTEANAKVDIKKIMQYLYHSFEWFEVNCKEENNAKGTC